MTREVRRAAHDLRDVETPYRRRLRERTTPRTPVERDMLDAVEALIRARRRLIVNATRDNARAVERAEERFYRLADRLLAERDVVRT